MNEFRPGGRRRLDHVLAEDYSRELDRLELTALRERRDEAAQEETDLSYLRRMLHARIDIVRAEQRRRSAGGGQPVLDQLTSILSEKAIGPATGQGRHHSMEPSRAGERRRRAESLIGSSDLSDVGSLDDGTLDTTLRTYISEEESVSACRRQVQAVVDAMNSEIANRYARGAASVDDLLAAQRGPEEHG